MKNIAYYNSPVGKLGIIEQNQRITNLFFCGINDPNLEHVTERMTPTIKKAILELSEYFSGQLKIFDLPVEPFGTKFQVSVWRELTKIPYGQTCTYSNIAQMIGRPMACRAVGNANNRNPISIIIPCHRVVGKNNPWGYAGGRDAKEFLINLEKHNIEKII